MLFVLHVQVFKRGDEGLGLEASGGSRGNGGVADGAVRADGDDVAPQRRSQVAGFIPGLSHTADVEATAEVNAVQNLRGTKQRRFKRKNGGLLIFLTTPTCSSVAVKPEPKYLRMDGNERTSFSRFL